jgi:hypothetical protein
MYSFRSVALAFADETGKPPHSQAISFSVMRSFSDERRVTVFFPVDLNTIAVRQNHAANR